MSSVTPKISLVLATVAVTGMMLLGYAQITHSHGTNDMNLASVFVTGFRDLHPSSSNFGVSFRPVPGVEDYVLTVYDTDTSAMPLIEVRWSTDRCQPFDELDYCIDSGPYLTASSDYAQMKGMLPYWFSIVSIYPNRVVEGERFCFDRFALDASSCPDAEIDRMVFFGRDGEWWLKRK